ncbi:hypothetical protein H5410_059085, partial [Solanum commersonii]
KPRNSRPICKSRAAVQQSIEKSSDPSPIVSSSLSLLILSYSNLPGGTILCFIRPCSSNQMASIINPLKNYFIQVGNLIQRELEFRIHSEILPVSPSKSTQKSPLFKPLSSSLFRLVFLLVEEQKEIRGKVRKGIIKHNLY